MTHGRTFVTRRSLALAAGGAIAIGAAPGLVHAQTPEPTEGQRIGAPAWFLAIHTVQDPYAGTMQAPAAPAAGTRYVAAEIEIINDSDQALNFTPVEVRVRDIAGNEYRGGGAIGTEPMISPRNLNPGERSRGWVWFTVAASAQLVELVYVAPGPQFRAPLTD